MLVLATGPWIYRSAATGNSGEIELWPMALGNSKQQRRAIEQTLVWGGEECFTGAYCARG
jgi:hypothetical protein